MIVIIIVTLVFTISQITQAQQRIVDEKSLNDSTNYIDVMAYGLRVTYPKCIQPHKLITNEYCGIISYHIGSYTKGEYEDETYMSIELATQNSIKCRSDAHTEYVKNGNDDDGYTPQTEQEYLGRKSIFQNNIVNQFYDGFYWAGNRRYGNHKWGGENIGYANDSYTYIDSVQIKITINTLGWTVTRNLFEYVKDNYGIEEGYNRNRTDGAIRNLASEIVYQQFMRILNKVRIEKL